MLCGFIGYGNMGSAIVRALLDHGSLRQEEVMVYNRTPGRLDGLRDQYPEVRIASSMNEVSSACDILFVCVHTPAVPEVMAGIVKDASPGLHLVTINGGVEIATLESAYGGPVSKVIPSITIGTGHGVTLISHGRRVSAPNAAMLEGLFSRSGRVAVLREESLASATDITSCGPGLLASMLAHFALSGAKAGNLDPQDAVAMAAETMLGTALILTDGHASPEELAGRVATRGGITEQGLQVLKGELPDTFDRMFEATRRKRSEVTASMAERYGQGCRSKQ